METRCPHCLAPMTDVVFRDLRVEQVIPATGIVHLIGGKTAPAKAGQDRVALGMCRTHGLTTTKV